MIGILLAGIALCIALSAFFSASEMAFSSCNLIRLENARDDGSKRAAAAVRITELYDSALSAILIGNNLVNIAASSMSSVLLILLTQSDANTWISTLAVTVLVIIFGETIPKITAKKRANAVCLRSAYALRALMIVLTPLIFIVVRLTELLTGRLKGEAEAENSEEAVGELQSIIETATDEEVLDEEQSELVQAAIDFPEVSAAEAMTARVDMAAVDIGAPFEEILALIERTPYSRLPVYEGSVDNIIGVLYLNHVLKALTDGQTDLRSLLMPPCYVYKTMRLPAVLGRLRRAKQHLAIVSDEYGGTLGVITMEDVLEQLVGEIRDETDPAEPELVERPDGAYELDGDVVISELLELLALDEASFETESETVGGWTLESFGDFPEEGQSFERDGLHVTVLAMDGRRVERILLRRAPEGTEALQ